MTSLLPDLLNSSYEGLTGDQQRAMRLLNGSGNVFITGGAGTGKSFVLRKFLQGIDKSYVPILASTGAAAVLIGGRTFHSFFGLGILEGGPQATLERALKDKRLSRRIKKASVVVIDEISMIPGQVLEVAELIARSIRGGSQAWGGLRVVAVGDFAQLPPVTRSSYKKDWAFMSQAWKDSQFLSVELKEVVRSREDTEFCQRLAEVRQGILSEEMKKLLETRRASSFEEDFEGSVLYARKVDVEKINLSRLAALEGEVQVYETKYVGEERYKKALIQNAPIAEKIQLKRGALVMLRQNDPKGKWVNGSLGFVHKMEREGLEIRLMNGNWIDVEPVSFTMLDAEGNEVAAAKNFPVNLAYAVTIHKAQGATLDRAVVSLTELWEPGQAYVALSRVKSSKSLLVQDWDENSIFADPEVLKFNRDL